MVSHLYILIPVKVHFVRSALLFNAVSTFSEGIYVSPYGSHRLSRLTIAVTHNRRFINAYMLRIIALVGLSCSHLTTYIANAIYIVAPEHLDQFFDCCGDGFLCGNNSKLVISPCLEIVPDRSSGNPQLTRRRNAGIESLCNHALVNIVRLTIESNILTGVRAVILVIPTI